MRTRGTGDDDEAFYFLPVSGMEGSRYMLSRDRVRRPERTPGASSLTSR